MPGLKTYHDGHNIYSVDMMIAYINIHKPAVLVMPVRDFTDQLKVDVWGDVSPMVVIEKIHLKKYASNAARIHDADLSYPIIVSKDGVIIDGYHRLAKAVLSETTTIKTYVFDDALMKKFILDKHMDFVHVHQHMTVSNVLEMWSKRFC
jgi:hypothetical protein